MFSALVEMQYLSKTYNVSCSRGLNSDDIKTGKTGLFGEAFRSKLRRFQHLEVIEFPGPDFMKQNLISRRMEISGFCLHPPDTGAKVDSPHTPQSCL